LLVCATVLLVCVTVLLVCVTVLLDCATVLLDCVVWSLLILIFIIAQSYELSFISKCDFYSTVNSFLTCYVVSNLYLFINLSKFKYKSLIPVLLSFPNSLYEDLWLICQSAHFIKFCHIILIFGTFVFIFFSFVAYWDNIM